MHKTDKALFTVTGTTFLTFLTAHYIGTIWILYPNVLIAAAVFGYCIWGLDEDTPLVANSAVFGVATTLVYIPMDWLLSRKVGLIFYLDSDFLASLTTPIGILLNWIICATLAAYCYQRCITVFRNYFATARLGTTGTAVLAAGVTGLCAAAGSTIIYALGESELWIWNATQVDRMPQIGPVPIFLPLSFLITFLLSPYFFGIAGSFLKGQHAGLAGIRCGIFLGALQFLGFLLFYLGK